MHKTKIDIPNKKREALAGLLNERLADLIDLKLQAKQAHWNVKGPNFIALHKLFDEIAGAIDEHVDTVAERITTLGGTAEGTVSAVSKHTSLPAYSLKTVSGHDHLEALSTAVATAGNLVRAAIDKTNELGDADAADIFTAASRTLDQYLWFLEAHLQSDK
jgi:starvation-inducible DNA-binding protein